MSSDEILAAAGRVFGRDGYERATLERIAQEAGVSRVTLHRRGVSKEALLGSLTERAVERYRAALWPALTARGTGRERLESALPALCAAAEEHRPLLEALGTRRDEVFHEEGEDAMTRSFFVEPLVRLIEDGTSDGTLRACGDPEERATVLFNLVGWTYLHLRGGHGWSPERATEAVVDVALNGVAA
ncbi:MAG TPA: TetR/AcrR family transcriptional regulator [Solirubrobacteraceae bacterium]|jgi:AcrR family transcriptional regulator